VSNNIGNELNISNERINFWNLNNKSKYSCMWLPCIYFWCFLRLNNQERRVLVPSTCDCMPHAPSDSRKACLFHLIYTTINTQPTNYVIPNFVGHVKLPVTPGTTSRMGASSGASGASAQLRWRIPPSKALISSLKIFYVKIFIQFFCCVNKLKLPSVRNRMFGP
jgi:hypothetical protein